MSAKKKRPEIKLNSLKNEIDIWNHKVSALLDDPKKTYIHQEEVHTISKGILQSMWIKQLLNKEDITTITNIEAATSLKRGCSQSPIRQTPPPGSSRDRTRVRSKLYQHERSVCDDVKVTLRFEEDAIQTVYDQEEYIQIKSENADLKKELERLGRNLEYLQQQREQLEFQVELLTTEKSTLSLEAQKKCKTLEDESNKRYKAERTNDIDKSEKARAERYRAERNLALLDNKELKKQIDELTGVKSDVQQKAMEMQALQNRIEGQSQYIQEIQKSAEEDRTDANDAIIHYKEEEQRYKKARVRANDIITKLKKEKDEVLAKANDDTTQKIDKIKIEKDETLSMLQKQRSVNKEERQRHKQREDILSKELCAAQSELENEKSKNCHRDREDIRSNAKLFEENEELKKEILDIQKRHTLEDYQKETLEKKNEELVTLTRKRYELEEELKFSNDRKSVIEMAYEEMKTKFQNMSQKLQESEDRYKLSGNKRLPDIEKENQSLSTELTMSLKTMQKLKQDYKILEKKNEMERSKYRETLSQIQAELNSKKLQEVDQRDTSRTQDYEKQNLTSKMYSLENTNIELHDRIRKAEANVKQMQIIRDENERLKTSLSELKKDVKDHDTKYKTRTQGNEDTITNLRDESETLRKDINIARKETERITREKDILAQELETELNVAKTEHDKLRKEKNELIVLFKEESKKDKDKINKLEEGNETLHTRCLSGEKAKQYTSYELLQLQNDYEICKKQKAEAEENLADLQHENVELEKALKELESKYQHCMKCDEYERKLNKLKKDYQELQDRKLESSRNNSASGEVISLKSWINILQSENAELKQRCQHQNKVQQEADNDKRKLHSRISQLESNITEIKQDKDTLISRVEVLREEKSDLEERIRRMSPQVVLDPRNCQNCWKYRNDISDLKREINDLRDRLTEAAGNKLQDTNQNIAELSDVNRPTSLADKFGSVYTDEYTDAMEVIGDDMDEKAVADLMLQWLKTCYDWCEKLAKEQRNLLTRESVEFMQKYYGQHMDLTLSDRSYMFLRETQKKIAVDTLSPVGKICHEKSVTEERLSSDSRVIKYLKKCSDLCWRMQIADPPMHLDFDIQQGQNLDKNYYNVFTKSGSKIDFLVWPVLKLHRNGPVLSKGVAQGR